MQNFRGWKQFDQAQATLYRSGVADDVFDLTLECSLFKEGSIDLEVVVESIFRNASSIDYSTRALDNSNWAQRPKLLKTAEDNLRAATTLQDRR